MAHVGIAAIIKRRVAPDVMAVSLRLPPGSALPFLAGQYVNVSNKAGVKRAYSIASAPENGPASLVRDVIDAPSWPSPAEDGRWPYA